MTEVIHSLEDWKIRRRALKHQTLGFVPTMGALHEGHLALIRQSLEDNDNTLVSIFINPTQFDDPEDFNNYPAQLSRDIETLNELGVTFVLAPAYEELYPDNYTYKIQETQLSHELCGAHRPGHFDGVLTVVMKLLNLACADRAYFGEKDYQQYQLVKNMARAFFLETTIVPCPIVRERDGLALSSRNKLLTTEQRERAPLFYYTLKTAASTSEAKATLANHGFEPEYVEDRNGRRFGAVHLGQVRLIDNVPL